MAETTVRKVKAPVSMLTVCPVCRETKTFRFIGFVERNSLFCCREGTGRHRTGGHFLASCGVHVVGMSGNGNLLHRHCYPCGRNVPGVASRSKPKRRGLANEEHPDRVLHLNHLRGVRHADPVPDRIELVLDGGFLGGC